MNLRLVSMIGENPIIFDQFVKHYKNIGVDYFHLILHHNERFPNLEKLVNKIAIKYQINYEIVHYSGKWNGNICTQLIKKTMNKYKKDWFIIADQDEFQIYKKNVKSIISDLESTNQAFLTGCLVDRISVDGSLKEIKPNISIWKQFPLCGFIGYPIARSFPYKITLCLGDTNLSEGQHGIIVHTEEYPMKGAISVQVHHFKWDSTLYPKLLSRLSASRFKERSGSFTGYYNELEDLLKYLNNNNNKIDINNENFFIFNTHGRVNYKSYNKWNQLISIVNDWHSFKNYFGG